MRIYNSYKRIGKFVLCHYRETFTAEFWKMIKRIYTERFRFNDRIPNSEFLYNLKTIEIRPWNLHIELTNICNSNCIFCAYRFQAREKVTMTNEAYSKALKDYCAIGGGELMLEGCMGDPLMDPQFIKRVKEARSNIEVGHIATITNGINIHKFGAEEILKSGINEIGISTAPWDEHLYESIFRNGAYKQVRENVKRLLIINSKQAKPIKITLLFRSNLVMKETLKLPDYQAIRNLPHHVEFNTDFDNWLGNIKQIDLLKGMHIRPACYLEKEPCYLLYDGPIIFSNGKVGLCGCRDFNADSEFIIGHILTSHLIDLWQSGIVRKLRKRFWDKDFPKLCRSCNAYTNLDYYRSSRGSLRAKLVKQRFEDSR